jgi:hypothetical protein
MSSRTLGTINYRREMALKRIKLRTCDESDLFLDIRFMVSRLFITNHDFESIYFAYSDHNTHCAEIDNTLVGSICARIGEVTTSYKTSFVSKIMFDVKNKMNFYIPPK